VNLIEKAVEELSVFKNLFDDIRIVDPVNKEVIFGKTGKDEELSHRCYELWERNHFCENCISMRAYINNDSFVKVEHDRDKIILMTATPVEIDGNTFIAEISKDITKNSSISRKLNKDFLHVDAYIGLMNEAVVKDKYTGVYNKKYIYERLPIDFNYSTINGLPVSIIMAQFDFTQKLSDNLEDAAPNKALAHFCNLIAKCIRQNTDWIARYGEKNFIIVLNNTDLKDAHIVTEKIKRQIENSTFQYSDTALNVTPRLEVYNAADFDISSLGLLKVESKNPYKAITLCDNGKSLYNCTEGFVNYPVVSSKDIKLERLDQQINEVREVLNELCCAVDEGETNAGRLAISQFLDELIVEYMKEVNNQSIMTKF
jgi:two-component system, cell cycle response regulator